MDELKRYEQIDQYLQGNLKGEELTAFEQKMASDASFAQEVQLLGMVNEAVVDHKVAQFYEVLEERNPYKTKPSKGPWKGALGISLALIGGLALTLTLTSKSPDLEQESTEQVAPATAEVVQKTASQPDAEDIEEKAEPTEPHIVARTYTGYEEEKGYVEEEIEHIQDYKPGHRLALAPRTQHANDEGNQPKQEAKTEAVDSLVSSEDDANPCLGRKISVSRKHMSASATCMDESNGEIAFLQSAVTGGRAPYFYSLNDNQHFVNKPVFTGLAIGEYRVYIKDSDNCEVYPPIWATVKGKDCGGLPDYTFNPDISDFEFPIDDFIKATIDVIDFNADIVYHAAVDGIEAPRWDGRSYNGTQLASGVYIIRIIHEDNRIEKYTLNIAR